MLATLNLHIAGTVDIPDELLAALASALQGKVLGPNLADPSAWQAEGAVIREGAIVFEECFNDNLARLSFGAGHPAGTYRIEWDQAGDDSGAAPFIGGSVMGDRQDGPGRKSQDMAMASAFSTLQFRGWGTGSLSNITLRKVLI